MKMKPKERNIYHQYHVPGCPRTHKLKKNAIFINTKSTVLHEMAKCLASYMVKKYGDVKFSREVISLLNALNTRVNITFANWESCPSDFITEAVPANDSSRRIDLVKLSDNTRYELETDPNERKEDAVTICLHREV